MSPLVEVMSSLASIVFDQLNFSHPDAAISGRTLGRRRARWESSDSRVGWTPWRRSVVISRVYFWMLRSTTAGTATELCARWSEHVVGGF